MDPDSICDFRAYRAECLAEIRMLNAKLREVKRLSRQRIRDLDIVSVNIRKRLQAIERAHREADVNALEKQVEELRAKVAEIDRIVMERKQLP